MERENASHLQSCITRRSFGRKLRYASFAPHSLVVRLQELKSVVQEETTGGRIASVANILEKSYSEMKKTANTMGIYATDKSL